MDIVDINNMINYIYQQTGETLKLKFLTKASRNTHYSHTYLMKCATCLTVPYPDAPPAWITLRTDFLIYYRYLLASTLQMDQIHVEEKKIYVPPRLKVEKERILTLNIAKAYREEALGNQSLQTVARWLCETTQMKNSIKTVHNTLINSV